MKNGYFIRYETCLEPALKQEKVVISGGLVGINFDLPEDTLPRHPFPLYSDLKIEIQEQLKTKKRQWRKEEKDLETDSEDLAKQKFEAWKKEKQFWINAGGIRNFKLSNLIIRKGGRR